MGKAHNYSDVIVVIYFNICQFSRKSEPSDTLYTYPIAIIYHHSLELEGLNPRGKRVQSNLKEPVFKDELLVLGPICIVSIVWALKIFIKIEIFQALCTCRIKFSILCCPQTCLFVRCVHAQPIISDMHTLHIRIHAA